MSERRVLLPEDMDSNVYLTEAQKNITTGNLEIALKCANKAVETGQFDPRCTFVRSRCHLLLGHLPEALEDAQVALKRNPDLVKALLVQAEAHYAMGEFEKALVLFHRGLRRRGDLAPFRKGIQKAKEAILNAIGNETFPQVIVCSPISSSDPLTTSEVTNEGSHVIRRKKEGTLSRVPSVATPTSHAIGKKDSKGGQNQYNLPISSIKTNKIASKRLLGGLSSDKEFLTRLLERKDLERSVLVQPDIYLGDKIFSGRKKKLDSETPEQPVAVQAGGGIMATAKDALSSLQHLEAFLWQQDPGELAVTSARKSLKVYTPNGINHHEKSSFRGRKGSSNRYKKAAGSKNKGQRGISDAVLDTEQQEDSRLERQNCLKDKVEQILNKLNEADNGHLTVELENAESFLEIFRKSTEPNLQNFRLLCNLLIGIGCALPKVDRTDDGLAVLMDAAKLANERQLQEEECLAMEKRGRILVSEGRLEEALEELRNLIEQMDSSILKADLLHSAALLLFESEKEDSGKKYIQRSYEGYKDFSDDCGCLKSLLLLAEWHGRHGDKSDAKDTMTKAAAFLSNEDLVMTKEVREKIQKLNELIHVKEDIEDTDKEMERREEMAEANLPLLTNATAVIVQG